MKDYEIVNDLIGKKIRLPMEIKILFENGEFELIGNEFKISLGDIFYFSSDKGEVLVTNDKIFKMLKFEEGELTSVVIDRSYVLNLTVSNCIFLAFPREIEGWAIYLNNNVFAAHYGWQSGIDW